jgi:hypothetical protein
MAQFSLKKHALRKLNTHECLDRQTHLPDWKTKMNAKTLIAAVTLLTSAGAVFAGNANPFVDQTGFVSTKTRTEVIAETQQVAAKGGVVVKHSNVASTRTQDEVRNEAIQAANSRLFNSYIGR